MPCPEEISLEQWKPELPFPTWSTSDPAVPQPRAACPCCPQLPGKAGTAEEMDFSNAHGWGRVKDVQVTGSDTQMGTQAHSCCQL